MTVQFDKLHDKRYRLNNLYKIVDKNGNSIQFRMNPTQAEVFDNLHSKNVILKARQLGMSTFCVLYLLDEVIFERNLSAGIVSYSLPHAQHIFKNIVGHALENMPIEIGSLGITAKSTKEINFENGSSFRVDTSLRGGTTQLVLITEFGKTCARSPSRADEVMAGTLESVPTTGTVIIESTGEGTSGPFTELCLKTAARGNDNLSEHDYKLFFFPWYLEKTYSFDSDKILSPPVNDYFKEIEAELEISFTSGQRHWYQAKYDVLGDKAQQEYPSTVNEAFISNADAFYYARVLQDARIDDRIVQHDLFDPLLPVYLALDIAVTDMTVITFFQLTHGEIRIIDHYADTNKGVAFYTSFLIKEKPYLYDTIYLPHDAVKKDGLIVENSYKSEFQRLFAHTGTRISVLPRTERNPMIAHAVGQVRRCVFNDRKCNKYIEALSKYRKEWSERLGRYLDKPYHDMNSDYADSFRYAMQAVEIVERTAGRGSALEKHKAAVARRNQR